MCPLFSPVLSNTLIPQDCLCGFYNPLSIALYPGTACPFPFLFLVPLLSALFSTVRWSHVADLTLVALECKEQRIRLWDSGR